MQPKQSSEPICWQCCSSNIDVKDALLRRDRGTSDRFTLGWHCTIRWELGSSTRSGAESVSGGVLDLSDVSLLSTPKNNRSSSSSITVYDSDLGLEHRQNAADRGTPQYSEDEKRTRHLSQDNLQVTDITSSAVRE